jgi:hypothetical protein
MGVAFTPGQTLGRGDLDLFLTNANGNVSNAYSITFALYWVDPASGAEVLVGPSNRQPVNPAVGEYYAAVMIPTSATPGGYRIRWTFKQYSSDPDQQVVQEFAVVATGSDTGVGGTSTLSACEADLVKKLRFLLRDNCIAGEQLVEVDIDGERFTLSMEDLYDALGDMSPPPPGKA